MQPEAFVETKKSRKAGGGKSAKIKEPPPAHEPFDARKRQRVADLTTQEERLLEEVASLKRSVPARAAADQADALKAGLTRDDEALRDAAVSVRKRVREQLADEGGDSLDLGVEPLDRQDVIEEEYTTAIEVLARLKTDMSAVVARMERARVAGEYVLDQS